MTSALNMLQAITIFRLYENHNLKLKKFINCVPVSLRPLRPAEVGTYQLGNCVGGLITFIDNQFRSGGEDSTKNVDEEIVRAKFWQLTREISASLEERVKNDVTKFLARDVPLEHDEDQLLGHMSLSNMGIFDDSSFGCFVKKNGPFRVENMFTSCNYSGEKEILLMGSYFCTVGDKLCCSLASNSYAFDPQLVDEFLKLFLQFVDLVLE